MTGENLTVSSKFCENMTGEHMAVHSELCQHMAGEQMAVHGEVYEHMAVLGTPGSRAFRQERSTRQCGLYCISI